MERQGSIYSLTFDEFQSALGGASKDFGSMNMDELLRNIWTAEESNAMAAAAPATATAAAPAQHQQQPGAPIQRQGSFTLPRTLSQKTVDEVWREIVGLTGGEDEPPVAPPVPAPAPAAAPPAPLPTQAQTQAQRQPTLGSMTLEEFLVRAGVVREEMGQQPLVLFSQGNAVAPQTLQLGNGMVTGVVGQGLGGAMTVAAPTTPVVLNGMGKVEAGDLSSLSPVPYPFDTALRVRKGPTVEKVVERRQRRMIKNRESAARSRARKQVKSFCSSSALLRYPSIICLFLNYSKILHEMDLYGNYIWYAPRLCCTLFT
jgi:ABA responsive element binding factor